MHCANCGRQNPDDANYCNNCGKPVRQDTAQRNLDQYQETCEILCQDILKPAGGVLGGPALIRFTAYAVGPSGSFVAGYSDGFDYPKARYDQAIHYDPPLLLPGPSDPGVKSAHDSLLRQLISEGWESTGRGQAWFNQRFRRQSH
jgi:hypothetical protein